MVVDDETSSILAAKKVDDHEHAEGFGLNEES